MRRQFILFTFLVVLGSVIPVEAVVAQCEQPPEGDTPEYVATPGIQTSWTDDFKYRLIDINTDGTLSPEYQLKENLETGSVTLITSPLSESPIETDLGKLSEEQLTQVIIAFSQVPETIATGDQNQDGTVDTIEQEGVLLISGGQAGLNLTGAQGERYNLVWLNFDSTSGSEAVIVSTIYDDSVDYVAAESPLWLYIAPSPGANPFSDPDPINVRDMNIADVIDLAFQIFWQQFHA